MSVGALSLTAAVQGFLAPHGTIESNADEYQCLLISFLLQSPCVEAIKHIRVRNKDQEDAEETAALGLHTTHVSDGEEEVNEVNILNEARTDRETDDDEESSLQHGTQHH